MNKFINDPTLWYPEFPNNTLYNNKYSHINYIELFKKGHKIHIKEKNRGKFTEQAKRAGMSVQEYAAKILANKEKYSPTLIKRANFARNANKFKHK